MAEKITLSVIKADNFKLGCTPTDTIPENIATQTSSLTAAVLRRVGLPGKAQGLDKKVPEEKEKISKIKDEADGLAKEIYARIIKKAGIILRIRVSEGFGRDKVAESFKANEVVNPEGTQGTEDAIIDVIEGTNMFVTDVNGKSLNELEDWESGATSVIVTGPGVESLGNCPDYYVDAIFTLVPKDKRQEFVDNPLDPELTAANPDKIEEFLLRIAKANNINIEDLEVVLMKRERETQRLAVLKNMQEKHPGLRVVTIKDGTVPHSLLANFGRKQGKLKVVMTVGGAPEGFLNLAVAGIFKEEGALASLRIYSENVNKTADGGEAQDLSRRYDFSEKEKQSIGELRPDDAEDIFQGNKLFTQEDVKGDVEGSFSFITNNGVFKIKGAEKLSDGSYKVTILRVGKIDGHPCAWFEDKIFNAEELEDISSRSKKANPGPIKPIPGKTLFNALKDTDSIILSVNMRSPLSIPGIIMAAKEADAAINFQLARSELGYCFPDGFKLANVREFAQMVCSKAAEMNFTCFGLKGDHITVKPKFIPTKEEEAKIISIFKDILSHKDLAKRKTLFEKAIKDHQEDERISGILSEVKTAQDLVIEEVAAGYTIFALDASFLPLDCNIVVTAYLDGFIPEELGHEGEVGEIGGKENTTPEEAVEFLEGLKEYGVKLDKMAINNGTEHGNIYDHQGNLVPTNINIEATKKVHEAIKPYGMSIVQHGVTGTPINVLKKLREVGITEAHVGTNWQNIVIANLPDELRKEMEEVTLTKQGDKETPASTTIGKKIKLCLGTYRARMLGIPQKNIDAINKATKKSALEHLEGLGAFGDAKIVAKHLGDV